MTPESTDCMTTFLLENTDIRGAHVRLTQVWQRVLAHRLYPPAIRRALGQLTAFAALLSARLKTPTRITLQAQGKGLVPLVVVDLSLERELRAVAQRRDEAIPIADDAELRELLGEAAQLALIMELPATHTPYISIVPWEGTTLNDALEAFLAQSDQQPTRLWLSADDQTAAGLMIQKLPTADEKDPDGWRRTVLLAETLRETELVQLDASTLLTRLFAEETIRAFPSVPIIPYDRVEPERIQRLLRLIGRDEVEAMLAEQGVVEIHDELSGHTYRLERNEALAAFANDLPSSPRIH